MHTTSIHNVCGKSKDNMDYYLIINNLHNQKDNKKDGHKPPSYKVQISIIPVHAPRGLIEVLVRTRLSLVA